MTQVEYAPIDWDAPEEIVTISENKQKRLYACGLGQWRIDPETGNEYFSPWRCDDYRNCEKGCRHSYAVDKKAEFKDFFITDGLFMESMSDSEGRRVVRQLRDNDQLYARIPQPDGVIIIHNGILAEDTGLRYEGNVHIDDLPLESWLKDVPEKKRITKGGRRVGASPKKEIDGEDAFHEFDSFTLHTAASQFEVKRAFAEAAQTCTLPNTWEDIPRCINEKLKMTKTILEGLGHVVYDVFLHDRIKIGLVPRWIRPQNYAVIPRNEVVEWAEVPL